MSKTPALAMSFSRTTLFSKSWCVLDRVQPIRTNSRFAASTLNESLENLFWFARFATPNHTLLGCNIL